MNTYPLEGENKLDSAILKPLVALVIWTFVMWAWLYATRIPAIRKHKIALDPNRIKAEFDALLPAKVRWKADNYNHLMEQPTLFYAVSLTLAVLGAGQGLNAGLAWLYAGLRIAHSLVHALVNVILLRFTIFLAASLVLLAMTVRAALIVF
ncbi:MAG: MAPEG family protein [Methylocella sp.]